MIAVADEVYDDVFSAMDGVDPSWRGQIGRTGRWTWVQATLVPADPTRHVYDVYIRRAGRRFSAFKRAIERKAGDRVRNVFAVRHRDEPDTPEAGTDFHARRPQRRVKVNPQANVFDRRARPK